MTKKFFKAVLLTGLIAGSLDAIAACIQYYIKTGNNPAKVFRYIASGAFGKEALAKNLYGMAAWGLLFHFLIALSFTLLFFLFYRQIKMLLSDKYLTAVLYGLFVWSVMNLLVVPVTFGKEINVKIPDALIAAGILIIAIGLPVSLMADRYYSKIRTEIN
ncbi:MAG: hypothetical protein HZB42_05480 [Sphingobacteriales bacterium]|nr:hypothetical protein [Sphingobacteriales bacterium]